jgi:hypothetical protein
VLAGLAASDIILCRRCAYRPALEGFPRTKPLVSRFLLMAATWVTDGVADLERAAQKRRLWPPSALPQKLGREGIPGEKFGWMSYFPFSRRAAQPRCERGAAVADHGTGDCTEAARGRQHLPMVTGPLPATHIKATRGGPAWTFIVRVEETSCPVSPICEPPRMRRPSPCSGSSRSSMPNERPNFQSPSDQKFRRLGVPSECCPQCPIHTALLQAR